VKALRREQGKPRNDHNDFSQVRSHEESLFADTSKNTKPKRKKNPIAAVRYVVGGKSNKITRIILTTSRMPQIVNDMIDIVSVAFLDIGYSEHV
jgi:hypothetical protein